MKEINSQTNPRQEMLQMGNTLVEQTDQIIKQVLKFFKTFNKQFTYVKLESFIFQEADYIDVAVKEVQEISRIFESYEITLNKMRNVGLYQKSEINQLQEIKHRLNIKGKVVSGA